MKSPSKLPRTNATKKEHIPTESPEMAKLLMRPWLERLLDEDSVPGLEWLNKGNMVFRVTWKHYSLRGWTKQDVDVFRRWAIHTGKYDSSKENPARWKTNFRCALNSLGDVIRIEVKNDSALRGKDAYRVFKFLPKGESKFNIKTARGQGLAAEKTAIKMMHTYSRLEEVTSEEDNCQEDSNIDHEEEVLAEEMDSDESDFDSYKCRIEDNNNDEKNKELPNNGSLKIPTTLNAVQEPANQEGTQLFGEYFVALNKNTYYQTLSTLADDEILLFPVEKMAEPVTVYSGSVL